MQSDLLRTVWPPLSALGIVKLEVELSSIRADFWEEERYYFYRLLLVEITQERRKRRKFSWSKEISLFLTEFSIGTIRLGTKRLETRKKFRPTERTLRWESARGYEKGLITEFWTSIWTNIH